MTMNRPYIILTMMTSIDGKIEGDFIHDHNEELGDYFERQKLEDTDAWGNGSNTHEKYFSDPGIDLPDYPDCIDDCRQDNIIRKGTPYMVSFDTKGKVLWSADKIEMPDGVDNHVLVVTTENVRPEYTSYLRRMGIPYIYAGKGTIDLRTALDKLYTAFGIRRFAIVGGATINASFLQADLVDEIRLVIAPFIDGSKELTLSEMPDNSRLTKQFTLSSVRKLEHDGVLLIYKNKNNHD